MRGWWLGAACVVAAVAVHAQGSVGQASPAAPTAAPTPGALTQPSLPSSTLPPTPTSPTTSAPNTSVPGSAVPSSTPAGSAGPSTTAPATAPAAPPAGPATPTAPAAPAAGTAPTSAQPGAQPGAQPSAAPRRTRARRAPRTGPTTPSPITDHFALSGIYFLGQVATDGQFDSGKGVMGTPFSAERTLGLADRTSQARAELMFRLEQRGRLRLDFLDLRRSGEAQIPDALQFGDQLFKAHDVLQSEVDWRQTDFTYTYSLLRSDRYELGVGAGVHLMQAYASAQVPDTPQRQVYSAAGPFVTAALDGTVRLARYWALSARGQYLKVTINSTTGMLGIYHADLQYRWRPNFAVGAGYEYERVEVDLLHSDPSGYVLLDINGPELFARLSF